MLADFAARGVVEPTGDGYRLTEQGARVAHDFAGAVEEVGS